MICIVSFKSGKWRYEPLYEPLHVYEQTVRIRYSAMVKSGKVQFRDEFEAR